MAMMKFVILQDFRISMVPQIIALELVQPKTHNICFMKKKKSYKTFKVICIRSAF